MMAGPVPKLIKQRHLAGRSAERSVEPAAPCANHKQRGHQRRALPVTVLTVYVAGDRDLVVKFQDTDRHIADMAKLVPQLRSSTMLPGSGHITQEGRPGRGQRRNDRRFCAACRGVFARGRIFRIVAQNFGRLTVRVFDLDTLEPTAALVGAGRHLEIGGKKQWTAIMQWRDPDARARFPDTMLGLERFADPEPQAAAREPQ